MSTLAAIAIPTHHICMGTLTFERKTNGSALVCAVSQGSISSAVAQCVADGLKTNTLNLCLYPSIQYILEWTLTLPCEHIRVIGQSVQSLFDEKLGANFFPCDTAPKITMNREAQDLGFLVVNAGDGKNRRHYVAPVRLSVQAKAKNQDQAKAQVYLDGFADFTDAIKGRVTFAKLEAVIDERDPKTTSPIQAAFSVIKPYTVEEYARAVRAAVAAFDLKSAPNANPKFCSHLEAFIEPFDNETRLGWKETIFHLHRRPLKRSRRNYDLTFSFPSDAVRAKFILTMKKIDALFQPTGIKKVTKTGGNPRRASGYFVEPAEFVLTFRDGEHTDENTWRAPSFDPDQREKERFWLDRFLSAHALETKISAPPIFRI